MTTKTAAVLRWLSDAHHDARLCPICKKDCSTDALVDVVYTFRDCNCGQPMYTHLVEQLFHKSCFLNQKGCQEK